MQALSSYLLKHGLTLFTCWLLVFNSVCSQSTAIGDWQYHLPNRYVTSIALKNNELLCGTSQAQLMSYHTDDGQLDILDRFDGLNDVGIEKIGYYPNLELTIVVYQNLNIDVIADGQITNINDIKNKLISGRKAIHHILFAEREAYLSTSLGIIVLDLEKLEIKDTYLIGPEGTAIEIYGTSLFNDQFYACSELGLHRINFDDPQIFNFNRWKIIEGDEGLPQHPFQFIESHSDQLFAASQHQLFQWQADVEQWALFYENDDSLIINDIAFRSGDYVLIEQEMEEDAVRSTRLAFVELDGAVEYFHSGDVQRPTEILADSNDQLWVAENWFGLVKISNGKVVDKIQGDGPFGNSVYRLVTYQDQLWVAPGGVEPSWHSLYNREGVFLFESNQWKAFREGANPELNGIIDFLDVEIHPSGSLVYFASHYGGLVRKDGDNYTVFAENSGLASTSSSNTFRMSGLAFDSNNNLWMTNYNGDQPIAVFTENGEWGAFTDQFNIDEHSLIDVTVDAFDQLWIATRAEGIVVYDPGEDVLSAADDRYRWIRSGEQLGNLPINDIKCVTVDRDGEVWVGTTEGLAIFYCASQIFNNGCTADRPVVEVDGELGYLLGGDIINGIAVDGGNRKWVATENGVWLLSDDGRTSIHYFNEENSPLISNKVISVAVESVTGTVYFGTDKGIVSYKSDAVEGDAFHQNVKVYPNPVRPDYTGQIAIRGLASGANVKITDVSGKLVYETTANGSQAIWHGKNYLGDKVSSGVYLVYSSNSSGTETFATKLLFLH